MKRTQDRLPASNAHGTFCAVGLRIIPIAPTQLIRYIGSTRRRGRDSPCVMASDK